MSFGVAGGFGAAEGFEAAGGSGVEDFAVSAGSGAADGVAAGIDVGADVDGVTRVSDFEATDADTAGDCVDV